MCFALGKQNKKLPETPRRKRQFSFVFLRPPLGGAEKSKLNRFPPARKSRSKAMKAKKPKRRPRRGTKTLGKEIPKYPGAGDGGHYAISTANKSTAKSRAARPRAPLRGKPPRTPRAASGRSPYGCPRRPARRRHGAAWREGPRFLPEAPSKAGRGKERGSRADFLSSDKIFKEARNA